ncbi:unnamed protein product, partial [Dicrocoelium dendriticum]
MNFSMVGLRSAPQYFPKPKLHRKLVMVTAWWFAAGLIRHRFLIPRRTIAAKNYYQPLVEMHRKLQHRCPALVNRKEPILLHDNVRLHVAQTTMPKLHELDYETLPHPPYFPDLSLT